ncbi:endonuclease/exonuclease/phosphatase family protein [Paracoccus saliphilus]|nr:endonuclease/exonuclease/phosphatase family protein [Paracoccus saliphilus]
MARQSREVMESDIMAAKDVSFCSFNLLNLQLPGKSVYTDKDGWSGEVYDRKIDFTAGMLARMDADLFGFQELWAPKALEEAIDRAGMAESHLLLAPPDHSGNRITCAAAIRRDLLVNEPEWIVDFPSEMVLHSTGDDPQQPEISVNLERFSRPVLRLQLRPSPDTPIIEAFVCHFKSKRPAEIYREKWYDRDTHGAHRTALGYALSTIRRTAEAAALRVLITDIAKKTETPVVLIGDMNDDKDSNTLNILSEQPRFLTALSTGGGDNALYAAQTLQEYRSVRDVYYTHIYQDQHGSLDHILVSEQFYDNSRRRLWRFDGLQVANDHLNWDDHKDSGTNDHGIILAHFKWQPARQGLV